MRLIVGSSIHIGVVLTTFCQTSTAPSLISLGATFFSPCSVPSIRIFSPLRTGSNMRVNESGKDAARVLFPAALSPKKHIMYSSSVLGGTLISSGPGVSNVSVSESTALTLVALTDLNGVAWD